MSQRNPVVIAALRAAAAALTVSVVVPLVATLSGCVALEPQRYRLAEAGVACTDRDVSNDACRHSIAEHAPDYDLHFVEFDDQGLQYPQTFRGADWQVPDGDFAPDGCNPSANDCLHRKAWAYQINNVIKALDRASADQPIVLLVFIHGWKHDARADDANVRSFRHLLEEAAVIERNRLEFERQAGGRPVTGARRVVGLYIGWRGQSVDVPGLDNLTFWTRKTAAMHIAEGSSRELFARLRAFKCAKNARSQAAGPRDCNQPPARSDAVKVVLIGHSFGGLILYNAISASLIETLTRAFDIDDDPRRGYWRFADLAVLINPAFEATRYAPLARIAATASYARYEPPLLVTVTSTTDTATSFWFRLGRFVNTVFEEHVDDEERDANRETVGHHAAFVTHRLELPTVGRSECPGWLPVESALDERARLKRLGRDLAIEYNNSRAFFRSGGASDADGVFRMRSRWVRDFCGGARLTVTGTDPNSPVWNVRAIGDPHLLPDHSDIGQPLFVAVFRQLYMDTIFLDHMVDGRAATVPP